MGSKKDLANIRFYKLVAIRPTEERDSSRNIMWLCKCDCGNEKLVSSNALLKENTVSCGCYKKIVNITHGLSDNKLYSVWCDIKSKCLNSKNKNYKYYGGKGVKICSTWLEDFMIFYNWATENGYSDGLTIDRIDVNGDYKPSNCRWVDMKTQGNNRTTCTYITLNDKTQTIQQWAERFQVSRYQIINNFDEVVLKSGFQSNLSET
ncbi:hypothetical protein GRF59_14715 [Paenibacillus sp. HJL G12]|uniref:AP2 domain-containing protein n=1 Tax=Paenibacillus dendrobii TaxID=2691084 RepID=A0A7X3LGL2_9BACL|nr:hypothetical protein [Paenibacillus dendrobii]MWV44871.1 hypothetical protein [Paenibacillus dendrobii]